MTDTVLTYLDSYCERAGDAALWAEPLNAFTNIFFIVAALFAAASLVRHRPVGPVLDLWALVLAMFAIGLGSGAWHLHPNGMTVLMDVIPITLFMNIYLISALRRLLALSWLKVALWWGLYLAATVAGQKFLPADTLHGTVMYLPTYAALLLLCEAIFRRDRALGKGFVRVSGIWTLSLVARTVDLELCSLLPIGTHFLWHTLNAIVLWRLTVLMIQTLRRA